MFSTISIVIFYLYMNIFVIIYLNIFKLTVF